MMCAVTVQIGQKRLQAVLTPLVDKSFDDSFESCKAMNMCTCESTSSQKLKLEVHQDETHGHVLLVNSCKRNRFCCVGMSSRLQWLTSIANVVINHGNNVGTRIASEREAPQLRIRTSTSENKQTYLKFFKGSQVVSFQPSHLTQTLPPR